MISWLLDCIHHGSSKLSNMMLVALDKVESLLVYSNLRQLKSYFSCLGYNTKEYLCEDSYITSKVIEVTLK